MVCAFMLERLPNYTTLLVNEKSILVTSSNNDTSSAKTSCTILHIKQTAARIHKTQRNISKTDPILEIHSGNLSLIMMQLVENTKPCT